MSEIHFDEQVDITDVVCPVTFVKAECSKKYQRRRTSDLKIRYKR